MGIGRIEEASLNATAVLEQQLYHGWLIRWAPSLAKRARSISVLAGSDAPLDERLGYAAEHYRRYGQPLIFRLTDGCPDPVLDAELERRGFEAYGGTHVMTAPVREAASNSIDPALCEADLRRFADEVGRLRDADPTHVDEHFARLSTVAAPRLPLLAYDGKTCVGAALGVLDGDLLGMFDVIADPARRRQGIATALVNALMARGSRQGASRAYLQVEGKNEAARALYMNRYGFRDHHRYWYRSPAGLR